MSTLSTWLPPEGQELVRHRLAIALRFVDPFTDAAAPVARLVRTAIPDRLAVSIPELEWTAVYSATDDAYRFIGSNVSAGVEWQAAVFFGVAAAAGRFATVPVVLSVEVEGPVSARYWVPSPLSVSLPVPAPFATHLDGYLLEVEAFPTALFRAPAGETCIRGVVGDGAGGVRAGVEVAVYPDAALPSGAVFTRTDEEGFFAYRLPWLKRPSPVPASSSLGVTVRQGGVGTEFGTVQASPHGADPARASFAYGVTTSITVEAF